MWRQENYFYVDLYNLHQMACQFECHQAFRNLLLDLQIQGFTANKRALKQAYLYFMRSRTGYTIETPTKLDILTFFYKAFSH